MTARSPSTPGGYCLARCYCRACPQYPEQAHTTEVLRQQEFDARLRRDDIRRHGARR